MDTILFLFRNFFTHKDYLPPREALAGTLFHPASFDLCRACGRACGRGGTCSLEKE